MRVNVIYKFQFRCSKYLRKHSEIVGKSRRRGYDCFFFVMRAIVFIISS